jgi:hypothetical protein
LLLSEQNGNSLDGGTDHASRRQIEVHRQAETEGGTHRRRLRRPRREQENRQGPCLGHGQQRGRRRQRQRLRPRKEEGYVAVKKGWSQGRRRDREEISKEKILPDEELQEEVEKIDQKEIGEEKGR